MSLLALMLGAPAAQANNLFTLDAHAETPGRVIEDTAGNAYIAWTSEGALGGPNVPMFCKVPAGGTCTNPISLPIPGATDATDSVAGAFPVFAGGDLLVVAPRYVHNDVVIWTSTNGGASFDGGVAYAGAYSGRSNPSGVAVEGGSRLLISADNIGLGFSTMSVGSLASGQNFGFTRAMGIVESSTLAIGAEGTPVEAYWTIGEPDEISFFRLSGGALTPEANWAGPMTVAAGYEPKLAGGPGGLYLVSQDYAGGTDPTQVDVRKFDGTGFGAPVALANETEPDLFAGGAIAEAPNGLLAVAWPGTTSPGHVGVMRLYVSGNGGASFGESEIAQIGDEYSLQDNAQLAIGENGSGWLTFIDGSGLHVADLTPIPQPTPAPSSPTPTNPAPKTYTGKTQTVTSAVGGNLLTLTVPKLCLAPSQSFFIGVGVKARHRIAKSLRSKLKVVKVTFSFDGKKLKTLKKKPFRYLVNPGALPAGGKHTVTARVTAIVVKHGHKKKVVRTLKGTISIC